MALILHIDTALETASVCLANNGRLLQLEENKNRNNDAGWLHPAIEKIMQQQSIPFSRLHAVAVGIGPGSYTGLRIGLSAAKGLCYALQIPLIAVGTLQMMAFAAREEPVDLLCPLIDARRQEVFTALYDKNLNPVMAPQALIVQEKSFEAYLPANRILFFGNGSAKVQQIIKHKNAWFKTIPVNASGLIFLAEKFFHQKQFAPLAYAEPMYLKEFHASTPKPSS
jgi:tRNA threonylcarbamoyladenosine biosynthesis protein TsaB